MPAPLAVTAGSRVPRLGAGTPCAGARPFPSSSHVRRAPLAPPGHPRAATSYGP